LIDLIDSLSHCVVASEDSFADYVRNGNIQEHANPHSEVEGGYRKTLWADSSLRITVTGAGTTSPPVNEAPNAVP
jgi:hypothetical protein